jgi:DNA repair protein RadC
MKSKQMKALAFLIGNNDAFKLKETFGDINRILQVRESDLIQAGLSSIKARTVTFAKQLSYIEKPIVDNEKTTAELIKHLQHIDYEQVWCIYLTNSNELRKMECIGQGSLTQSIGDFKRVITSCYLMGCERVILCHNHPDQGRNNLSFSQSDKDFTRDLRKVLNSCQIDLVDHVLIGRQGRLSMKKLGLL